ncbi:MAG TPA: primosomal protein N' [Lachnospiraceae bacterium]|jgi:primosomal protein N' (replication factor Y)|nr:primosomal protein N' [Lachnospiraceae bacterium]HBY71131.1 primosomal protein N' [Lachnospiraceae bacterium]HCA68917.1 primosomal protein N' [Lachnospiraceae bacterium]HCM11730.1 primosomal protein N' [Lachnospiraceae bacterium]
MSFQTYADIIIDISNENLDKTYQYAVPEKYLTQAKIGAPVVVSFGKGNRQINGYIVGLSGEPKVEKSKIKPITEVVEGAPIIESHLIYLADWIKETFGGTMNDALKTVIPVRKAIKHKEEKTVSLTVDIEQAKLFYYEFQRKNNTARARLLEALIKEQTLDYEDVVHKLNISKSTLDGLEQLGITKTVAKQIYRNPIKQQEQAYRPVILNEEQRAITDQITKEYKAGNRAVYLIHGVTGSGKTEVYMEVIADVIAMGKQVILLIPEIALTYQTVLRFYKRFGDRVSILNSRMSQGERYDQSLRAKRGEIDLVIGPRSALFTPFLNLGLIVIDEEHETSYKSETTPKYHAVEVAVKRAELTNASVILGSATPSLESYRRAMTGEYKLFQLRKRAKEAIPPKVWIVDLREELKKKNKSIFSEKLKELIADRLAKKEQIMLFLNRRGYAGFVSCRSCGHVMKCPHCDVALTSHNNRKMVCHYCGYEEPHPSLCPTCGSKFIAAFGTGTQKVEELVRKEFPGARVLRMDTDTTKKKDSYGKILSAFASHQADILVGTQMIVKGHDFPLVTLVGIIAADLSLYVGDFRASERTFQLLCQAAGRAGRDVLPGEVVIQTYHPEHYSIVTAAKGDYESFYKQEMLYRKLMQYPPAAHMLLLLITSKNEESAIEASVHAGEAIKEMIGEQQIAAQMIGPATAGLAKANDYYRRVIYIKHEEYNTLIGIKDYLEGYLAYTQYYSDCSFQFDFDPMSSY